MVTISEWTKDLKYTGQWQEETLEDALELIESLKVSSRDKNYIIENESGTVLEVVKK